MKDLKFGIIGMSEGNGHPYSWSAIFNGYNREIMKTCPFPVIPEYLSKQNFPDDCIPNAKVTHIWTQNKSISKHIAQASNIECIVDNYSELIGNVDAILLARDDEKSHYEMSADFLKAGLPIYIDKPLSTNKKIAEKIYSLQQYEGQIFTCSALSYAKEFQLTGEELSKIGVLKYVDACVMKDWDRYGIHVVEPVLKLIGNQGKRTSVKVHGCQDKKIVIVSWESGLQVTFSSLGSTSCPIAIRLFGNIGHKELVFSDTYFAFKQALNAFVEVVLKKSPNISKDFVLEVVKIIEEGKGSD